LPWDDLEKFFGKKKLGFIEVIKLIKELREIRILT